MSRLFLRGYSNANPISSYRRRDPEGHTNIAEAQESPRSSLLFSPLGDERFLSAEYVWGRGAPNPRGLHYARQMVEDPDVDTFQGENYNYSSNQSFSYLPRSLGPVRDQGRELTLLSQSDNGWGSSNDQSTDRWLENQVENNGFADEIYTASTHFVAGPLSPPHLDRRGPIPLPPLSANIPTLINQFLSHHDYSSRADALVYWNMALAPSTARLAIASEGHLDNIIMHRWSHARATEPESVTSFTIRIEAVNRPVFVFPAHTGSAIRIIDIMGAVYDALRFAAFENPDDRGARGQVRIRTGAAGENRAINPAEVTAAIVRYFDGRVWWAGLYESLEERDVWILERRAAVEI